MEKSQLYSFSAPGIYRFVIFCKNLGHNLAMENWHIINTEDISEGLIINAQKSVKDQAHLMGLIQEIYDKHFTIISIMKESDYKLSNYEN